MVYPEDGITKLEALSEQKRLAALLSYKLKRDYSDMCCFVRARIPLAIVRSDSLLLRGPCKKGALIRKKPDLADGAVMALLAPWRG